MVAPAIVCPRARWIDMMRRRRAIAEDHLYGTWCQPEGGWCPVEKPLVYARPWRAVATSPVPAGDTLEAILYRLTVDPPAPAQWGVMYEGRLAPVAAPERWTVDPQDYIGLRSGDTA